MLASFGPQLRELASILKTEHTSEVEKRELKTSVEQMIIRKNMKIQAGGAARMDEIVRLATTLPGYEMSYFQRCCMDAILCITAPIIFRGGSAQELAEYFKKTNRKLTRKMMLFMQTSRRSGKTDLLTILAAIFLVVIPNVQMLGWSLYNETSEMFGRTMAKWLVDLKYTDSRIRVSNNHVIFHAAPGDTRAIYLMGSRNPNVSICIYIYIYIYI